MEPEGKQDEPLEITAFVPRQVDLIDSNGVHRLSLDYAGTPAVRRRPRKWLPIFLFIATCASTWLAGTQVSPNLLAAELTTYILSGFRYAVPVMLILLAHEMGHYLQTRRYGVPASLPYFIPMPISPLGTLGAVIVQGRGVADRKQMFDIAISGPLAGLVLALPIAYFGMQETEKVTFQPGQDTLVFGDPLIVEWMKTHFHGPLAENEDVRLTPLLLAGWVGILVTALNLIPIGQLDGGHILYCIIGRRAHRVAIGLLLASVAWMWQTDNYGYVLIVILLILFGPRHPPTADDTVPLGLPRVMLGWLTLAFIVVGFTPVPISKVQPPPSQRPKPPLVEQTAEHASPHFQPVDRQRWLREKTQPVSPPSRSQCRAELQAIHPSQRDFMKASACSARYSSEGNIGRQIFVAAAKSGRASPNASTVIQPS